MSEDTGEVNYYGRNFISEMMCQYRGMILSMCDKVEIEYGEAIMLSSLCIVQVLTESVISEEDRDALFLNMIKNMHNNYKRLSKEKKKRADDQIRE